MLYRPKYCCNCGEKIERVHWNLKTSRRFCELCETDFVLEDWLPRVAVVLVIAFGAIGAAGFLRTEVKEPAPVSRGTVPPAAAADQNPETRNAVAATRPATGQERQTRVSQSNTAANELPPEKGQPKRAGGEERFSFCGAETKKGTPCSRRVRKGERCWQHSGRPSISEADPSGSGR